MFLALMRNVKDVAALYICGELSVTARKSLSRSTAQLDLRIMRLGGPHARSLDETPRKEPDGERCGLLSGVGRGAPEAVLYIKALEKWDVISVMKKVSRLFLAA